MSAALKVGNVGAYTRQRHGRLGSVYRRNRTDAKTGGPNGGAASAGRSASLWHTASLVGVLALTLAPPCRSSPFEPAPPTPPRAHIGLRPVAIFGDDERQPLPAERTALARNLGILIDTGRNVVCTAVCVAPATVLTAAHCLFPPDQSAAAPADIRFRRSLGSTDGEARVKGARQSNGAQHVLAGTTRLSLEPPIDAAHDWALIRLDRPACTSGGLPLSRRSTDEIIAAARDGRVYNAAFHRDFGNFTAAVSAPCSVGRSFDGATWDSIVRDFADPDRIVLHTCDTGGSSSGSPLLVDEPSGPEIVAVNVGTYLVTAPSVPLAARRDGASGPTGRETRDIANTAVAGHAFADLAAAFLRADIIEDTRGIARLQTLLASRGLRSGRIDGLYGPALKAAIEQYETAAGLPATGLATRDLLRRLGAVTATERD